MRNFLITKKTYKCGKEYEAEIDELERKFCLFEIED
jgi:hypothetical protein